MDCIVEWEDKQEYNLFYDWMEEYVGIEFNDYIFDKITKVDDGHGGECYRVALKMEDFGDTEFPLYWPLLK